MAWSSEGEPGAGGVQGQGVIKKKKNIPSLLQSFLDTQSARSHANIIHLSKRSFTFISLACKTNKHQT